MNQRMCWWNSLRRSGSRKNTMELVLVALLELSLESINKMQRNKPKMYERTDSRNNCSSSIECQYNYDEVMTMHSHRNGCNLIPLSNQSIKCTGWRVAIRLALLSQTSIARHLWLLVDVMPLDMCRHYRPSLRRYLVFTTVARYRYLFAWKIRAMDVDTSRTGSCVNTLDCSVFFVSNTWMYYFQIPMPFVGRAWYA